MAFVVLSHLAGKTLSTLLSSSRSHNLDAYISCDENGILLPVEKKLYFLNFPTRNIGLLSYM